MFKIFKSRYYDARNWYKRFKRGFKSVLRGFLYIIDKQLLRFIFLPSLFSILTGLLLLAAFYLLFGWLSVVLAEQWQAVVVSRPETWFAIAAEWLVQESAGLDGVFGWLGILIRFLLAGFITLLLYRVFIPVTVLPFLGPLLNQIEMHELGEVIETGWIMDAQNTLRSMWVGVQFALVGLLVLLAGFCLGPFELVLTILFQSWVLGRSAFDLVFEKQAPLLRQREMLIREFRPEIMGHGLAFLLLLLIPVVGLVVAPVSSACGVALVYYRSIQFHKRWQARLAAN
ncbi:MAG: EI24 domain-containing protein [Leptospiraceae bacterium]|nr:EI24 domain-containing protein [Leptospiraceae bacterium]